MRRVDFRDNVCGGRRKGGEMDVLRCSFAAGKFSAFQFIIRENRKMIS